ncbi:carboxypeptidase-like regulatory domain-containing protein, partial [candidate division WOR-3 bacterium]|nr:carboxypeptidase-like regulatory domain-containing protein [candidate division WOR-3 bacterium]
MIAGMAPGRSVAVLLLAVAAGHAATVSGFVRDARDGEPLAYVSVYLEDRSAGTATDKTGYYVLSGLPAGEQAIVFSIVGYKELERVVTLTSDRPARLDPRLAVEVIPVAGVTASAERQRFRREVDIGVKRLDIRDLKIAPGFIEQDLFKSL